MSYFTEYASAIGEATARQAARSLISDLPAALFEDPAPGSQLLRRLALLDAAGAGVRHKFRDWVYTRPEFIEIMAAYMDPDGNVYDKFQDLEYGVVETQPDMTIGQAGCFGRRCGEHWEVKALPCVLSCPLGPTHWRREGQWVRADSDYGLETGAAPYADQPIEGVPNYDFTKNPPERLGDQILGNACLALEAWAWVVGVPPAPTSEGQHAMMNAALATHAVLDGLLAGEADLDALMDGPKPGAGDQLNDSIAGRAGPAVSASPTPPNAPTIVTGDEAVGEAKSDPGDLLPRIVAFLVGGGFKDQAQLDKAVARYTDKGQTPSTIAASIAGYGTRMGVCTFSRRGAGSFTPKYGSARAAFASWVDAGQVEGKTDGVTELVLKTPAVRALLKEHGGDIAVAREACGAALQDAVEKNVAVLDGAMADVTGEPCVSPVEALRETAEAPMNPMIPTAPEVETAQPEEESTSTQEATETAPCEELPDGAIDEAFMDMGEPVTIVEMPGVPQEGAADPVLSSAMLKVLERIATALEKGNQLTDNAQVLCDKDIELKKQLLSLMKTTAAQPASSQGARCSDPSPAKTRTPQSSKKTTRKKAPTKKTAKKVSSKKVSKKASKKPAQKRPVSKKKKASKKKATASKRGSARSSKTPAAPPKTGLSDKPLF